MFESIFTMTSGETSFTLSGLAAALGTAFALGLLISLARLKIEKERDMSQSFALTLVLLPAVVTVIIMLVGNNVARAFSLVGAFSIIRFRSVPGNPKDITYVLFSMAVGLAAGMGYLLYAAIVGVALCAVATILEITGYAGTKNAEKLLKIRVPENLNFGQAFDPVLQKYTQSYRFRRIKTSDLGSVYELSYGIIMKNGVIEKDFIDELRILNGNMNIALLMDAPTAAVTDEF